jgi:two-component system response regulator ArlR
MNHNVLIIEDEKQIAGFLKMELEHEGYEAVVAYDGREGLDKVKAQRFDVILLDIMMPYINGFDVCRRIRTFSDVPIIMLTAKEDIADKVTGLDSGANDYVTKPFDIEELFARIRSVTRKAQIIQNKILDVSDLSMNTETHEVLRGGVPVDLTKKEFDLLEQLLVNKGIVLSRDRLLQNVWETDYFGDSNVVDVTIKHLRVKIHDDIDKKIISTIRGYGYVIRGG